MPGEQVDIRDGELWLNGQMLQKDWEQLAAIAVTVSEFPQHKVSHWWLGDPRGDETRLEAADRVISSQGELSVLLAAEQWLQWLYQRPARVHPDQVPRAQWMVASPLIDELDCNQGIARIPHVVEDYWLSIGLASRPKGPASVECSYRGMSFCIDLEPALPASQPIVTETLATGQQRIKVPMGRFVDVAFCDHRLLIRSDEAERILPWHEIVEIGQRDAIPGLVDGRGEIIRISCRGAMMIHRLSIARDLHLLPEVTGNFSASTTGSTGYFLLGDNLAVSADSRGELGRVGSNRLLGRVRRSSEHPQSSAFSIR
jgi:hypothetical protein